MKIGEIVQRVQSLYSKGVASDDSRLSNRLIYNKMLTVRSRLVVEQAKKKQRISRWNYQTISCIELIEVSTADCPCVPPPGCTIMRSRYKLPKPLSDLSRSLIDSVMTIDRGIKLNEITINAVNASRGNKFAKKSINYFIEGGYLYVSTPTTISLIKVIGIFEDPIKASQFESYCPNFESKCLDFMEEEFPLDEDMLDVLVQLTVEEVVTVFAQSRQDDRNDGVDNSNRAR